MDFTYNENQTMIADMIRSFGEQHISPLSKRDENQTFRRCF